jgi:hypothetical protein
MYGVDDRNQITIRSAGRRAKPSQPEAAAKDAGPVPAMAGVLLPVQQPHVKAAKLALAGLFVYALHVLKHLRP